MDKIKSKRSALPFLLAFFIGGPLLLLMLLLLGIGSYFWVSPEIRTMRNSVIENSSGKFDRKIELNVGRWSFAAARLAGLFLRNLPDEARTALNCAQGAQVSVYETRGVVTDDNALFKDLDVKMENQGWERVVGAIHETTTVALFVPRNMNSPEKTEICAMVLSDGHLVCVYGKSNVQPLVKMVMEKAKSEFPEIALN